MTTDLRQVLLLAGNGFIGQRVAAVLASAESRVVVYHTGRTPVPNVAGIRSVVADRTLPPVVSFPDSILTPDTDVAIHFLCMGKDDAQAFVRSFDGRARRLVLISSCDVYRAYGRFIRTEPGPPDPTPLDESGPVREQSYPYRSKAANPAQLEYWYDKLDAERIVREVARSEFVIIRLPKVYGPGPKHGLHTVFGFAHQPFWRWTHGHVDNVAAAIALIAFHPGAAGHVFNLGEKRTPTIGERLAYLTRRDASELMGGDYDFRQDLHFDTRKVRDLLGYEDVVDEIDAMKALA
jgi:nucleoside-diphosphate-sugar epimerase